MGELPHFSFNLPHPQDLSRDIYTHRRTRTHTHTHTHRCRLSWCPVLHHLLSLLWFWSPITSSHIEFTWSGLGDSSFSALCSGPVLLGLDPWCSDRWNVASRGCLQAAKRMPRGALTLTNSLLGPPGLSSAWQLVERRWHLNCGLGRLNSSGGQNTHQMSRFHGI